MEREDEFLQFSISIELNAEFICELAIGYSFKWIFQSSIESCAELNVNRKDFRRGWVAGHEIEIALVASAIDKDRTETKKSDVTRKLTF